MKDYKKKYEEALGRARTFNQRWQGIEATDSELALQELKEIFPELKESKDKRIKTNIIKLLRFVRDTHHQYSDECNESINWLEKQGRKNHAKPVTVIERDGERWVRVCALGEDFIIAAHDYQEGDKTEFTWEEACKIGTFSKKQGYIMLALKDKINARLKGIGGEPLASYYWSSSEYGQDYAWTVYFGSGYVSNDNGKYYSGVARAVAAF